jgi:phosphate transport system substrate-binding protein
MKLTTTALALTLAGFSFVAGAQAQQITGAGSSFGAPIYGKWAEAAAKPTGLKLNYQSIGSGAGINQINNRTVDFGATDMPVKAADLEAHKEMQFPTVIGGVVMVVNIPGVEANQLKLTGELVSEIYEGKIKKWNDEKIVEMNNGLKLPNLAIAPVYRADGSGTTFVFTDYLSMLSPTWKSTVGSSTSVKWPAGNGAKGSEGVSAVVKQVKGGIGYVESAYAEQNHLVTTQLRNKAGSFVKPDMESFAAAAASADWSKAQNFAIDLNDQPGAKSWPIESATFVLLPKDAKDPANTKNVIKLFDWAFANGDKIATDLLYIPLPDSVHNAIRAAWKAQFGG